ncbi:unnamed protein product, partial [Chrysoparadoxa australica]
LEASSTLLTPVPPPLPSRPSMTMSMPTRSKAIPFMPQPAKLDGTMVGDVGFDPLGLSAIDFDFSTLIVPPAASQRNSDTKISTLYWMREAELKHGRVAMLAVLGWVMVDLGLRFPGAKYAGLDAISAHDAMVATGNMKVMLHFIGLLELIGGVAIYQAANGSGREPGDFCLDPLGLSYSAKKKASYQLSELKNGRLAMLAFGGIATQAVLTDGAGFPYTF